MYMIVLTTKMARALPHAIAMMAQVGRELEPSSESAAGTVGGVAVEVTFITAH
jgi:hypothetical protein